MIIKMIAPSLPEGVDDENTEKQQAIAIWIASFLMKFQRFTLTDFKSICDSLESAPQSGSLLDTHIGITSNVILYFQVSPLMLLLVRKM